MSIVFVMPSNHLILCRPFLLLPSIFPSIRVFSSESTLHMRWPEYWGFHISLSSEYSGLIFFRMDWLDLLAVQGTLKSLLQHHSWEASVLWLVLSLLYGPYLTMKSEWAPCMICFSERMCSCCLVSTMWRFLRIFIAKVLDSSLFNWTLKKVRRE